MLSLNESWSTFFGVLASFLLFGIGIPSLVIQIIIAEDIKRVAFKNNKWVLKHNILVAIFGTFVVLFIWILHPTQSQFNSVILKSLPFLNEKYTQLTNSSPSLNAYIVAAVIMTVTLFLLFYVWREQFQYSRENIIKREVKSYTKQVEKSVNRNPLLKRGRWQKKKVPPDIWGIKYLGENGAAGREKEMALQALEKLEKLVFQFYQNEPPREILIDIIDALQATLNVNASSSNYLTGMRILEDIIDRMSAEYDDRKDIFIEAIKTIETTLKTGNIDEGKYHTGIRALKQIISASGRIDKAESPALIKGLQTINHLAKIAYREDYRAEISQIIGIIASTSLGPDDFAPAVARVLLDQGVASITGKYYDIAVEILNRFETLIEKYSYLEAENAQFYLGLVAHFWCSGNATRQRAQEGLKRKQYNKTELNRCLRKVRDLHYCAARLETVEKLDIMIKELAKAKI